MKLIDYTKEPLKVLARATLVSYWDEWSIDKLDEITEKDAMMHIPKVLSYGHESILEHIKLTFAVEGVSVVTLKQITRHRLMSFTVRSQRYIGIGEEDEFVIPNSLKNVKVLMTKWRLDGVETKEVTGEELAKYIYRMSMIAYENLIRAGVPSEDARYVIPQAITTKFVVTMNMREFKHFIGLRMCERAQWEIRELAKRMWEEVYKVEELRPILKWAKVGPRCIQLGYCPERELAPEGCYVRQKKWWEWVWGEVRG